MVCIIQGSECDTTYDVSTGYVFTIFKNCHSAELHKIVEAKAPENPYDTRQSPAVSVRGNTKLGDLAP